MSVGEKKSILVIDDDITIRKLISHHLNLNNYKVFLASNSDEGFEQLFKAEIDLVLCDITMDKMDGFTFCSLVRENEKYRSLPFVFVTAKNSYEDKSKALDVGGDDFITKPFNVDELVLKIKSLLRRAEINRIYGTRKNLAEVFAKSNPKVVIVDDDKAALTMYCSGLSKEGIDCEVATTANEGLKVIKNFRPDLIIADIMMPDIDGFKFREMILNDNEVSSIPFVFLSNLGTDQEILQGFDKDITDYILKSSGYKIVVAKISSLLKSLKKERNKIVTELREASDFLKTSVVAEKFPEFENFNIQYWHVPYSGIPGGDFIDYFLLDDDHLSLVLGDVMGKKWGAWYFAYAYAGYIRSAIHSVVQEDNNTSPSKIISRVNNLVHQDSKISEVFSTLSVIVIDKKNLTIKYSGAGDLPIFYKNSSTKEIKSIESKGPLLGFSKDAHFNDSAIQMNFGDTVILSTDGLIECRDEKGNLFGVSKFLEAIQNQEFLNSPLQVIKDNLMTFNNQKFDDDVSIVSISASQ
jgi:sigma-B regulation protein RsbU (phosphoserine phosphatase)